MYTAGELGSGPSTVFNGSQPHATSGTVNPEGYVDRELNKPSQTRSGLAGAALRRLNGGAQQQTQPRQPHISNRGVAPVRTPQGHIVNQNRNPGVQGTPVGNHPQAPRMVATAASSGSLPPSTPTPEPTYAMGALQSPAQPNTQVPNQPAGHIPLDPGIANLIAQQQTAEAQFEGNHQQSLNDALARGTEQQGLIQHQAPLQEAAVNAGFGGRGMFYSTGHDQALTNLHDSIARKLADLQQQETIDQRNYGEAVASGQTRLADQIAQDYQKNAQLADQQSATMDLSAANPDGSLNMQKLMQDIFGGDTNALNLAQNGAAQKLPALPNAIAPKTAPKPVKAPSHSAGRLTAKGAVHPSQKKKAGKK